MCITVYFDIFGLLHIDNSIIELPMPCASTVGAFVSSRQLSLAAMVALAFQPAISPGTVCTDDTYNMELRDSEIKQLVKSSVFKPIVTINSPVIHNYT